MADPPKQPADFNETPSEEWSGVVLGIESVMKSDCFEVSSLKENMGRMPIYLS